MRNSLLFCLCLIIFSLPVLAQEKITITRIDSPITFDGIVDDQAWQQIDPLPMVQYEPTFEGPMHERTEIRVAYDENYIYVAGRLFTEDPSTITTNSLYRDRYSSDDVFAIIIDGFNDDKNATWFFINPAGVRFDIALSNDADFSSGQNVFNSSYNTYWDAITTQDEEGWYAEMRIPFSSIGIQVEGDTAEIGFIVYRWITNLNERHIFPAIPPNWNLGNAKPSQAYDVKLTGVEAKNPVYFTPYALGGYSTVAGLNNNATEYIYNDDPQTELGFDLKYNVTNNLTLDATVNTDFAQVEADDQQLNLSRFSLFFPEKRQFFQQRSGQFEFNYGGDRVFYSRRIGLDYSGNPVRILGGARLTGRAGKVDIGFMDLQTGDSENLPTENFGVLRLKGEVLNSRSYIGGIITSRQSVDNSNWVYGVDGDINITGEQFFEFRYSDTEDTGLADGISGTSALRLGLRKSTSTGLNYSMVFNRIGENYMPGIGFVRIGGTTENQVNVGYGVLSPEKSVFRQNSVNLSLFSRNYNDRYEFLNYSQGLQIRTLGLSWNGRFKQAGQLNAGLTFGEEVIRPQDTFSLPGGILIPEDDYENVAFNMRYEFSEAWKVGGGMNMRFGSLFDGDFYSFSASPRFFISRKLEIGGSYSFTHLNFPARAGRTQTEFTTHLAQFRAQYAFDKKASLNTFIQYSNVSDQIGANLRFRYNFSEGRDLWLVYNEQAFTERDPLQAGLPRLPYLQSRSILLKYTHTLIF